MGLCCLECSEGATEDLRVSKLRRSHLMRYIFRGIYLVTNL